MCFRFYLWHFRDDFPIELKRKGKRTRGVTRTTKEYKNPSINCELEIRILFKFKLPDEYFLE